MQLVGLDERTRFMQSGGEGVVVDPGLYRVEVIDNEQIALIAENGKTTIVEATSGAHPMDLDAPFAVAFDAGASSGAVFFRFQMMPSTT